LLPAEARGLATLQDIFDVVDIDPQGKKFDKGEQHVLAVPIV
jgi:hypothetical protein